MKSHLIRLLYATALAVCMFAPGLAFATPAFCYGTTGGDGACTAPALEVQPASLITLPADIAITTDRSVTLVVSLSNASWFGPASSSGGSVISSSGQIVAVTCSDVCVLALPRVTGLAPGNNLRANIRLFSPNGITEVFFDGAVVLASMAVGDIPPPADADTFTATAWALNPASNTVQRTFLRIVAPDDEAQVVIYATDDNGSRRGPLTVSIPAGGALQLTATDLEQGNPGKGIPFGFGAGAGKWRVDASSATPFRLFALSTGLSELPVE